MKEVLKQSVNFWQSYWGNSLMPWLLLAAVSLLVIFRRKKKITKYLLFYLFLVLALFFCPPAARIIQKCIGSSVYWRVLWLSSGGSCYCCGYDRISEGEKRHFAVSPGHSGGRSGSCVRKGHLSGRKL